MSKIFITCLNQSILKTAKIINGCRKSLCLASAELSLLCSRASVSSPAPPHIPLPFRSVMPPLSARFLSFHTLCVRFIVLQYVLLKRLIISIPQKKIVYNRLELQNQFPRIFKGLAIGGILRLQTNKDNVWTCTCMYGGCLTTHKTRTAPTTHTTHAYTHIRTYANTYRHHLCINLCDYFGQLPPGNFVAVPVKACKVTTGAQNVLN